MEYKIVNKPAFSVIGRQGSTEDGEGFIARPWQEANENFPEVQITLYRYDGSHCLAVVDGESVSLVDRTAVVDLIEAIHAIVLD